MNEALQQAVIDLVFKKTGKFLKTVKTSRVYGGDINDAWKLDDGRVQFFVKINRVERLTMFEAEKQGLAEVKKTNSIRVPDVIGCGASSSHAFIVMEYIELTGSPDVSLFAQQLAAMHRYTGKSFGFTTDNTIGSTPQRNDFADNWVEFWQTRRLGYQLELAAINRLDTKTISLGEKLNTRLNSFFEDYQPLPSLLHGDLWSGNQGADSLGNPVIYDPACYFGDHEADLAMMELFGRPGAVFFDAYREIFPIDPGYTVRRELYNLYHILNHANLFGGGYMASARRMIDSLLAEI